MFNAHGAWFSSQRQNRALNETPVNILVEGLHRTYVQHEMQSFCFITRIDVESRKLRTSQSIVVYDTDDVSLWQAMAGNTVPLRKMNGDTCVGMDMSEDGAGASSVSHSDSEKASMAQVLNNVLALPCWCLLGDSLKD